MNITTKKRVRALGMSIAALCFAGWVSLVGYVNWAMHQPPEVFGHVMAKMPMPAYFVLPFRDPLDASAPGAVERGRYAPDFDGQEAGRQNSTHLASLWADKPVVLVFGSYT
jgi:hypothetical protein